MMKHSLDWYLHVSTYILFKVSINLFMKGGIAIASGKDRLSRERQSKCLPNY